MAQAFDRVWHEGLHKIQFLSTPLYLILKSFLTYRTFVVRCDKELSRVHPIKAIVLQGSILTHTLYNF